MLESIFVKEGFQPAPLCLHAPKPSPWGEGGPAKPGRMRGRPCTQPFLVEVEKGGSLLSPQRTFSPAPLGKSITPSSVTSGDSFPPRGSLWVVQPYPKKRPKSGHVNGHRNSLSTGTMWHPTPKRASANERALKMGGRGATPRDSLRPGFLLEKAWIPRPGPGGEPTSQVLTCDGPNRTTCQGRHGAAYPLGECLGSHLGAQRPVAPPARRGSPFLPRNGEKEGRGQAPWTPVFMARLLPLARFGVCATLSRWRGYYGTHVCALIWRLSFIKCFFSIFFPENAFQIGLRIPEEIAPRTDPGQQPPKRASANERALTQGGRGATPRDSLRPGFL